MVSFTLTCAMAIAFFAESPHRESAKLVEGPGWVDLEFSPDGRQLLALAGGGQGRRASSLVVAWTSEDLELPERQAANSIPPSSEASFVEELSNLTIVPSGIIVVLGRETIRGGYRKTVGKKRGPEEVYLTTEEAERELSSGRKLHSFQRALMVYLDPHDLSERDRRTFDFPWSDELHGDLAVSPTGLNQIQLSEGAIALFETSTGRTRERLTFEPASGTFPARFRPERWSAAYGDDSCCYVAAADGARHAIWRIGTDDKPELVDDHVHPAYIANCRLSPDLSSLAVAYSPGLGRSGKPTKHLAPSGVIEVWDVAAGVSRVRLPGNASPVTDLRFSSDGRLLAACTQEGALHVWDTSSGKQRAHRALDGPGLAVRFSPDGKRMTTLSQVRSDSRRNRGNDASRVIRLWDVPRLLNGAG